MYFALNGLKTASGVSFAEMCISLVAGKSEQIVFDVIPKDANIDDFVNLKALFNTTALAGSHPEKRLEYYQILLQYTISVIEIDDENLGLDEVIEVFERLNLGGKKLTLFSIIAARSYKPVGGKELGFNLSKRFEAFNKTLQDNNYGKISDSTFLQSIAACLTGKVNKSEILRNLKSDLIITNYVAVEKAIFAAIEHLKSKSYGVLVANLLPYERLLVPFAYFHFNIGKNHITTDQERYLEDFFWRSILAKRYNSSADTNMNTDLGKIQKIIEGNAPAQEPVILMPKTIWENGRFTLSSAYVLGILCLMAQAAPQSFAVGRSINITNDSVSSAAKKQYHHFFPMKSAVISDNAAYNLTVNNVVNIVFMDAITNDQISNRNPSDYITEFQKNNPKLAEALESHYIELNGYGIKDDNFFTFINARSRAFYNKLYGYILRNEHDTVLDNNAVV